MSSDFPQRRSIRLKGYDYSHEGAYFVTWVTQERLCLFGQVVDEVMNLSDAGRRVTDGWESLPGRFQNLDLDSFVIMPNHVHGIIVLSGRETERAIDGTGRATTRVAPTVLDGFEMNDRTDKPAGAPLVGAQASLGDAIGAFKSMTNVEYIRGVRSKGWPTFPGKIWQRNYYEHIVRNEESLSRIRDYITNNPREWLNDENNPSHA